MLLRGGFEKAWMPLGRLLGGPSGASGFRGRVRGLAEAFNDGRRALRSRSPNARASCCSVPLLDARRVGDLLSARSNTSGCDRARLALVGDWKEGRNGDRVTFWLSSGGTAIPVDSLVFRRLAGESIVAWGVRSHLHRADEDKQRCLH
jgi:hypothetical protein